MSNWYVCVDVDSDFFSLINVCKKDDLFKLIFEVGLREMFLLIKSKFKIE